MSAKSTKQNPETSRKNIQRGSGYLFLSVLIIALLAYVFPSILNIDIRSFAQLTLELSTPSAHALLLCELIPFLERHGNAVFTTHFMRLFWGLMASLSCFCLSEERRL